MGQYSFDGQFDGSNRFEYGQGNNNGDMFYGMGDYDYSAGWDGDYFGDTGMTMVIDSNGKIGVNRPNANGAVHDTETTNPYTGYVQKDADLIHDTATQINSKTAGNSQPLHDIKNVGTYPHYDSDNLTRYWSFMHRLWGQASANQREFIDPLGREVTETGETAVTSGATLDDKVIYGEDKPLQQGTTNPTSTGDFNDWIGEPYSLNALTSADSQAGNVYHPSRWFGYHENNKDVTNNLSKGSTSEHLAGRFLFGGADGTSDRIDMLRGRHGKTLYDLYGGFNDGTTGVPIGREPWDILNSHNRNEFEGTAGRQKALPSGAHDTTWGFSRGNIVVKDSSNQDTLPPFGEMGRNLDEQIFVDTGFFDSSWELGKPLLGEHTDPRGNEHFQQDQRWFEGINESPDRTYSRATNSVVTVGTDSTDEPGDTTKMKCWTCEIQYSLHWDPTNKHFYTTDRNNEKDAATGSNDSEGWGAWGDCERRGESKTCEYSSGVCFVEERRTFGYITLVRKGCKQAQACYMQKYQNFLVQAGRQCWPADGSDSSMKVASRPHDIMADQWIYNLVSGGNPKEHVVAGQWNDFMDIHWPHATSRADKNIASTFDFKFNTWNDGTNDANIYDRHEFDNTFVDVDPDGQVDRTVFYNTFKKMKEIHGPTFGFYKVTLFEFIFSEISIFFKDPMAITQLPHDTSIPPTETNNYWGNGHASSGTGLGVDFPFIAHPATNITPGAGVRTFTNPVPTLVSYLSLS